MLNGDKYVAKSRNQIRRMYEHFINFLVLRFSPIFLHACSFFCFCFCFCFFFFYFLLLKYYIVAGKTLNWATSILCSWNIEMKTPSNVVKRNFKSKQSGWRISFWNHFIQMRFKIAQFSGCSLAFNLTKRTIFAVYLCAGCACAGCAMFGVKKCQHSDNKSIK